MSAAETKFASDLMKMLCEAMEAEASADRLLNGLLAGIGFLIANLSDASAREAVAHCVSQMPVLLDTAAAVRAHESNKANNTLN